MIRSGSRSGMRSATSRRREQLGVEPVAERAAVAAVELVPALLGRRDLDAADRVEAGQPVELERLSSVDRRPRELRHRVRRVELEHEPRRVRRRAAGLPQRALVDDHDVGPALAREVVGDARADDAGADDHRARGRRQGRPPVAPLMAN